MTDMNILRKIGILSAVAAVSISVCGAQSLKIARVGETGEGADMRYVIPSTTLVVDVTVKHENVKRGEYARYAQKYLGVIAPLADKDIYTVESARIQWFDTGNMPVPELLPIADALHESVIHTEPGDDFMRVLPDKVSVNAKGTEEAARDAANMIYSIRKRRVELIMGDIGENIYGEGLRAAIERMDRIENEYLELFLGKQSFTTSTQRFYVVPEKGRNTYVVCRLSTTKGLLPVEDLSGEPLLIELRPEGIARAAYPAPAADVSKKGVKSKEPVAATSEYAVADMVICRVTDGKKVFVETVAPVYQMGVRVSK